MAVVVVNEMHGANQEIYDEVSPKVMPEGQLPDGCKAHIAGPIDDGWRVITVWDSEDQFQRFRDEALIPTLQDTGHGDRIAPSITTGEVYRFLTA